MNISVVYHEYYLNMYFYLYCNFNRNILFFFILSYIRHRENDLMVLDSQTLSDTTETLN